VFRLFAPKYPLTTYEKTWAEWRMRWFADKLGIERLLRARVVLPTKEFFPDAFDGSEASVRAVMDRLSQFMGVDTGKLGLEILPDIELPRAAGHYDPHGNPGRPTIRIAESQAADPDRLVATLAHELSHEILLGGKLIDPREPDHEWTTDLLPVYLGVGLFAANATVREGYERLSGGKRWQVGRQGYLPSRIFGYALTLFAFMRAEDNPAWAHTLRPDAAVSFNKGMRFLAKSHDSLFYPTSIRNKHSRPTDNELVYRLEHGTPTIRISSLWELRAEPSSKPSIVTGVSALLRHRDPDIVAAAANALSAIGPTAVDAVPQLVVALSDTHEVARAAAARALGAVCKVPESVLPDLEPLLEDEDIDVAIEAARAVGRFGKAAERSAPKLLSAMRSSITRCRYTLTDALADAFNSVAPDPISVAESFFTDADPDISEPAMAAINRRKLTQVADNTIAAAGD
jgi:hypothetical protein